MTRPFSLSWMTVLWLAFAVPASAQRVEVGGSAGWSGSLGEIISNGLFATVRDGEVLPLAFTQSGFERGRAWSSTTEIAANRWFTHGVSFVAAHATYSVDLYSVFDDHDRVTAPLVVRSVSYAFTAHVLEQGAAVRPFVYAGPSLVSFRFDSGLTSGGVSLPFQQLGVLARAYELGSIPPLEGGTLYRVGLRYGAGVKLRLSERLLARVEYAVLQTRQLDFLARSVESFNEIGYIVVEEPFGVFRQGTTLLGLGVTF